MLARVQSYLLSGIDALACEVEVDVGDVGENRAMVVGLADAAVKESQERVRSALVNSGYHFPRGRVVMNLAPADVRKEGNAYDLPIAVGLLMAQGVIGAGEGKREKAGGKRHRQSALREAEPRVRDARDDGGGADAEHDAEFAAQLAMLDPREPLDVRAFLVAGELALDGRVRPIKGVIAMAALAKELGLRGVIVPRENAAEAAVVGEIEAIGVSTLTEAIGILSGRLEARAERPIDVAGMLRTADADVDFGDVRGQEGVKRAIVIAAAGSHNLLMLGPAGTGKSMMAKALAGVLPPLTAEEAVEITRVYSAAGALPAGVGLMTTRPVRTPHHTASQPAIIGGGIVPRPGEVSLAHRGVLFLDELPEFPRFVLETLRQPLEDHVVTVARSHSAVKFPASFMLVAAMNPTPKGDKGSGEAGRREMERYLAKLSGPLIDRIDVHVEAPAVPWKELSAKRGEQGEPRGTSTAKMREMVLAARERQAQRQGAGTPNSRLSSRKLDELAALDEPTRAMLGQALTELGLSARAYDKIRRVARTIADVAGSERVKMEHVSEAVGYRLLDRKV